MSFKVAISPQMLTSLSQAHLSDQQTRSAVAETLVLIINSIEFTQLHSLPQNSQYLLRSIAGEESRENGYGYMAEDMNSELAEVERMLLDEIMAIKAEQNIENDSVTPLLAKSTSIAEIPSLQTREVVIAEEVDLYDVNQDAQSWLDDEIIILRQRTERRKLIKFEALREASAVKLQRVCRGGLARRWTKIKFQLSQIRNRRTTLKAFLTWIKRQTDCKNLAVFISNSLIAEVLEHDFSILLSNMLDEAVQQHNAATVQNTMKAMPPSQTVSSILSWPGTSERRQRKRSVLFAAVEGNDEQHRNDANETLTQIAQPPDNTVASLNEPKIIIIDDPLPFHKEASQQTAEPNPTCTDIPLPSYLEIATHTMMQLLQSTMNWQDYDQSAAFTVGRGLKLFKQPKPLQLPELLRSKTGVKDMFQIQNTLGHQSQVLALLEMMNDSNNSNILAPRKDGSLSTSSQHSAFFHFLQHSSDSQTHANSIKKESFKTEISSSSARNTLDMSVEGLSSLFFLQSMPSSNSSNIATSGSNITSNSSIVASTVNKLMLNINKLTSLDGIEAASNTRYLSIADNQISSLRQLEMLRELEFLNGDSNRLDTLDLGLLQQLATLSLNCNSIRQIDRIACPKLRRLELYSNRLVSLHSESFKSTPSLTYLNLGRNEIIDFDGMVLSQSLPLLHTLILSQNRLTMVPKLMLPCLRTLWLNANGLEGELAFSTVFQTDAKSWLPSLKSFYLHDNRLSVLSPSLLDGMPMLSELDLSFNRFDNQSAFQPLVQSCARLESLKVNDNAMPMSEMPYIKQWVRSVFPLIRLFNGEETSTTMSYIPDHNCVENRRSRQLHLLSNLRLREEYQVMVSKKTWQRAKKGYVKITDPSLEIDSDLLSILKDKVRILCGGEAVTMTAIAKELHLSYLQLPAVEVLTQPAKAIDSNAKSSSELTASTTALPLIEAVSQASNDLIGEAFSITASSAITTVTPILATLSPNAPPALSLDAAKERCAIRIQHLLKAHRRKKQTRQVIRSVRYEDEEIAHILGNDTEDIDALLNLDWLEQDVDAEFVAPLQQTSVIRSSSSAAATTTNAKIESAVGKKSGTKHEVRTGHRLVNREESKVQEVAEEDETSSAAMSFVYGDHIRRRGQYNKSLELNNQHGIDTAESPPKSTIESARESVQRRESKATRLKEDWGITDPKLLETMMKRNRQNQNRKKKAQGPRVISL